jgi:hypothetical protein
MSKHIFSHLNFPADKRRIVVYDALCAVSTKKTYNICSSRVQSNSYVPCCYSTAPEKYSESTFSFRRQCLKTKWVEVGADGSVTRKFADYSADRVERAIHLIRDPFDNIVSRYHLERKLPGRKAAEFPKSREGFRSYCSQIDDIHTANENRVTFLDEDILSLIRKVPCHADFLR